MGEVESERNPLGGGQRLSLDALRSWEQLEYGMFVHFGMSTYEGVEHSQGASPSRLYAPDRLAVDQWIQVARDAGMRYAVLTAKHESGHCLWPTRHTDYHVGTSGNPTDVVAAFVKACERHGVMPGLYYSSADNHHRLGTRYPNNTASNEYFEFQMAQIDELLTGYGPIGEVWIDIPHVLTMDQRVYQYEQIARLQPRAVIMMNHGFGDGSKMDYSKVWPTDLMAIERWLPNSHRGYQPWFKVWSWPQAERDFYIPGEVCDPIGYEWFFMDGDSPRADQELLGMRLICQSRNANLLLNVPPDKHGQIRQSHVEALMRLRKNFERATG